MFRNLFLLLIFSFFVSIASFAGNAEPAEKCFVSTDRDVYVAGDFVYFSVNILNKENKISDYVYVSLIRNNSIIFKGCLKVDNYNANGSFYITDTLTSGVYQLISYTNCMRNYGTSALAIKDIIIANRFDNEYKDIFNLGKISSSDSSLVNGNTARNDNIPVVDIKLNKALFAPREKVSYSIILPEELRKSKFSVSVRQKSPVSIIHNELLNNENNNDRCFFLPEKDGLVLQGTLKMVNQGNIADKIVFMSCKDSVANLQYTNTNAEGNFSFFLNPYYIGKTVVLKVQGEENFEIATDSKYDVLLTGIDKLMISGDLSSFLDFSQKCMTIQRSYNQTFRREVLNNYHFEKYRPSVYLKDCETVKPADYMYLPDFREISRELLPFYRIREKNDDFVGSIFDEENMYFSVPYLFLDGVLLEHVRQIMYLDSKKINKIQTIHNSRFIGNLNLPGILSIYTNSSEIENVKWKYPIRKITIDSIMSGSIFQTPEIISYPRNIPVYLQLLSWEPNVTSGTGNPIEKSFYTSDCTGTFEIVITGITDKGKGFNLSKTFQVSQLRN